MRGGAETAGTALIAVAAAGLLAIGGGLLAIGAVPPTPRYLYVVAAAAGGLVAGVGALLATTGRLPELHANQARTAATAFFGAAVVAANPPPAADWYFRELFLVGSGGLFVGGAVLVASAGREWIRGGPPTGG